MIDFSQIKALIVDDDQSICDMLSLFLESKGISTDYAYTGEDALNLLKEKKYDLLIVDQNLPDMKGSELVRRAEIKNAYIVLLTGDYSKETIEEITRTKGINEFIGKPFRLEQIEITLFRALNHVARQLNFINAVRTIDRWEVEMTLPNDLSIVREVAIIVTRNAAEAGFWEDNNICRIAVGEAIVNAMIHGNLEVPSKLRESSSGDFWEEIERRASTLPYLKRRVFVKAKMDREVYEVKVRDEGKGFDWRKAISSPPSTDKPFGRGLAIIRVAFDKVFWNDKGNEITMIKYKLDKAAQKSSKGEPWN